MRVIAGSARRLLLKTIEGMDTRPTTDRIKETLFNMLNTQIPGCTFLDLFAGSGAIGIEALSRGAKQAFFVESNPEAVSCIRENLSRTHLEEGALVLSCDVIPGLKKLEGRNPRFDIIFMDPPYQLNAEKEVLTAIADSKIADEDTQIIIEATLDREFSEDELACFDVVRVKEYKTNKHIFLQKSSREA